MKLSTDRDTGIIGVGLTETEAIKSMNFHMELNGHLTAARIERRNQIHAWLPDNNILHVKGVGAILYENNQFRNLRTGKVMNVRELPLSHYLHLFNAFDGLISFEDFTLTIGREVNQFLRNISSKFLDLKNFPYIKPAESLDVEYYHSTEDNISVMETHNNTIVMNIGSKFIEVDKTLGVNNACILSYMFASEGYMYDGKEIRRIDADTNSL